jgi:hypothetical protein
MLVGPRTEYALFGLSLLTACSAETHRGVEVRLVSRQGEVSTLATLPALDGVVRLDALSWAYTEVELSPCVRTVSRAYDLLVPNARAHGTSTPTRLAAPIVQSLESRGPLPLGTLRPPATRYCAVNVTLAAADRDAAGLVHNPAMLEKSFEIRGTVGDGATPPREFAGSTAASARARVPVELDLESGAREVTLSIARDPARWFVDVTRETLTGPAFSEILLQKFAGSTQVLVD